MDEFGKVSQEKKDQTRLIGHVVTISFFLSYLGSSCRFSVPCALRRWNFMCVSVGARYSHDIHSACRVLSCTMRWCWSRQNFLLVV
jgi:hypothetical protein